MNSRQVVVCTYLNEIDAEIARVALEAAGIACIVVQNDAGGMLQYANGAQVVVREDELEAARQILEEDDNANE
jgi:hypothetical protein